MKKFPCCFLRSIALSVKGRVAAVADDGTLHSNDAFVTDSGAMYLHGFAFKNVYVAVPACIV